jgi:hypothetical protein
MKSFLLTLLLVMGLAPIAMAQEATNKVIPPGSKVFVNPMEDGFHEYLKAALQAKKVPLVVVDDKKSADFAISGHSETDKASTAKKVIMWNWHSNEQATFRLRTSRPVKLSLPTRPTSRVQPMARRVRRRLAPNISKRKSKAKSSCRSLCKSEFDRASSLHSSFVLKTHATKRRRKGFGAVKLHTTREMRSSEKIGFKLKARRSRRKPFY